MPTRAETAVLATIDDQAGTMLAQVEAWSAINSGSHNLAGLARMAEALRTAFAPLGGAIELVAPEPVTAIDAGGGTIAVRHGDNLHLIQRPEAPRRVLLTGHMDTVFGVDHPFQASGWLGVNQLNGPGVADMKSGLAIMLAALSAIEGSPYAERLGYEVIVNSDEEVGSPGSAAMLRAAAGRVHAGLTFEPAQPDGALAGARKGSGNFSAVISGRAAHAGREPEKGRNAIVAAADLTLRLAALAGPGLSVNPARVDGGGANNVVPDRAILRFNLRPSTLADQQAAETALREAIRQIEAEREVGIALHGGFGRPPKPMDDTQTRLFELVRACGAELGLAIAWRDTGGVCDGNNLAATGLPVVDTLGARGGAIHSDAEYLWVDSLVERARLAALVLMRLADAG